MRIAVIGATGVLGRHLVPRLVERGHAVCATARRDADLDRLKAGGAQSGRVHPAGDIAHQAPVPGGVFADDHRRVRDPVEGGQCRTDFAEFDELAQRQRVLHLVSALVGARAGRIFDVEAEFGVRAQAGLQASQTRYTLQQVRLQLLAAVERAVQRRDP